MNRLLYCAEILAVILTIMQSECAQENVTRSEFQNLSSVSTKSQTSQTDVISVTPKQSETVEQSSSLSPGPQPTSSPIILFKTECLQVFMVCGGLILACTLLLLLTLILLFKVCRLSRRLKSLSTSGEQVGVSEYRVRTAEANEGKSEDEVKETDVLMADMSQNKTEISNGTAKEDGQEVKEKEVEDTPQGDEASPTDATTEGSPSSELQKEATDSEPTTGISEAPASESTEEPKGVE